MPTQKLPAGTLFTHMHLALVSNTVPGLRHMEMSESSRSNQYSRELRHTSGKLLCNESIPHPLLPTSTIHFNPSTSLQSTIPMIRPKWLQMVFKPTLSLYHRTLCTEKLRRHASKPELICHPLLRNPKQLPTAIRTESICKALSLSGCHVL